MMRMLRGWLTKPAQDQARLLEEYQSVFGSDAGKRVLTDLLDQSEYFQTVMADAGATALAAHNGKRAVAEHILTRLTASYEARRDLMRAVIVEREKETQT